MIQIFHKKEYIYLKQSYKYIPLSPQFRNIPNIHSTASLTCVTFKNWLKSLIDGIQLNNLANIKLAFPPPRFEFDARAINDIIAWYYDDKRFLIRIRDLINDISPNPFTGGKGHTEAIAGTNGKASKRIIKKDRLVYTYTEEKITIHQCRGHYNDT